MIEYTLLLTKKAEEDLAFWKRSGQTILLKKILKLFEELVIHPETGIGQPEQLRGDLTGYWSRRIDKKNRLIYRIDNHTIIVEVISLYSHYGQK